MKIRGNHCEEKIVVQMTSMIDVTFLLLIFFIMTFKISDQEGDFNIRMPMGSANQAAAPDLQVPLKLRLRANNEGRLAAIQLNDTDYGLDFPRLQQQLVALVQAGAGATENGPELEIDSDYNLRYEHVIQAITSTSGYKVGDQIVKLIEKVKFAPPRK